MENLTCIDFNPSASTKQLQLYKWHSPDLTVKWDHLVGQAHATISVCADQTRGGYIISQHPGSCYKIGLKVKFSTHALYSTSHRWFRARPDIPAVIFCFLQSWKTLRSSLTDLWSISIRLFPGSTQGHTDNFLVTFIRILMTDWNPDNASGILLFVSVLLLLFKFVFGSWYKPKQNWCHTCMSRIASSRKNSIWNCHVYTLYLGIRNKFVAKQVFKKDKLIRQTMSDLKKTALHEDLKKKRIVNGLPRWKK